MKKILSLIGVFGLITISTATTLACTQDNKTEVDNNDKLREELNDPFIPDGKLSNSFIKGISLTGQEIQEALNKYIEWQDPSKNTEEDFIQKQTFFAVITDAIEFDENLLNKELFNEYISFFHYNMVIQTQMLDLETLTAEQLQPSYEMLKKHQKFIFLMNDDSILLLENLLDYLMNIIQTL